MTDEQLLQRWQAGDSDAGAVLVRKHRKALGAFFRGRVPPNEVQDISQETLLAVVEGRHRIRSQSSFRAFVFGVARLKLLERRRARTTAPLGEDLEAGLVSDVPSAPSVIANKSDSDVIIAAFRSLPMDEQILLQLSGYEALKRRELAEVFDVPVNVIGGRLFRARQRLRRAIEKLRDNPVDVDSTDTTLHRYWRRLREDG